MFFVTKRVTLLIPSGTVEDPRRKHLFVCVTDPVGIGNDVLLVSVSSLLPSRPYDGTCRLYAGDHPFIRHDSYVVYARARIECADKLVDGVKQCLLIPQQALDGSVFARICQGFQESRFVTPKIRSFFESVYRSP